MTDDSQQNRDGGYLVDAVFNLAEMKEDLTDTAKLVVLAALESDAALATALNGVYTGDIDRRREFPDAPVAEPAGAFLESIKARGFRGIGPEAQLTLQPAPGLTIVAGRNGSGKSSFSEALELALTGNTYRWSKRTAVWAEHWRNIHDSTPCEIRIKLAEEGVGATTVGVDWADDAKLPERRTWVQRQGKPHQLGVSSLGWDRAIELYRPILSYEELSGLLEAGPSTLFDKLDAILGIEQATDAQQRLANAMKELQEPEKAANAEARELKKVLDTLDDGRATRALTLLRKRPPDLNAVQAIATGTATQPAAELGQLRLLTRLPAPTRQEVSEAAQTLRDTAKEFVQASTSSIDLAARRTNLLRQALEFHQHRGEGPCPVCGEGILDDGWRARVERELMVEDDELKRLRQARQKLDTARASALTLIRSTSEPTHPDRFEITALATAHLAWQQWSRPPGDDVALAEHLEATYGHLADAFELVRHEAAAILTEREDAWAPLATRLARWVELARKASENEPMLRTVQSAVEFAKGAVAQLRTARLDQLAVRARKIWAALRQESNVDLGGITLEGQGTRRHVKLHANVDGTEALALGVMSQGELHALALALFLPRATMSDSPFRFIVLDDPIQAMDPAKVDGFVQVLAELATDRQVIVLSHDDRLPQAVRQMGLDARILEVCRDTNSALNITSCLDPARRYLDDAFAVAKDEEVPGDVKVRVIPGLCRMAVEAAARDVYMARHFSAGHNRVDVEAAWQDARTTKQRFALAVRDDKAADLSAWLNAKPWRRSGHQVVTKGVHEGIRRNPIDAVRDTERIIDDLRPRGR